MVNSKLIRKGLALTASVAVAAATLVATSTSAQAVTTSASVTVPSGLRAGVWYDEEIHGLDHEDGTIFQGAFYGPFADDLYVDAIQLLDAPDGVNEGDSSVLENDCLVGTTDNDGAAIDPAATYNYTVYNECTDVLFPEPGNYVYKITFADEWDDVDPFSINATIVVGGTPTSAKITGGSTAWPELGDFYSLDNYFLTYYDAAGRVTSLVDGYEGYLMMTDDNDVEGYYDLYENDDCEVVYQLDAVEYQGCGADAGDSDEEGTVFTTVDNTFRAVGGYEFVAGSYAPGTAKLWFRTWVDTTGDWAYAVDDERWAQFNSDYGTLTTKAWVSDVWNGDTMTEVVEGAGVANDVDYWSYVRDDVDTVSFKYSGGAKNADKFVAMDSSASETYVPEATNPADGDDWQLKLTDASGVATFSFDLTDLVAGDIFWAYIETWGADADNYEYDGVWSILIQSAGFYPQMDLVNTSTFANIDPESYAADYDVFAKSYKFGDRVSLTYLLTDIWGTPMADYQTEMWNNNGNATLKSYENYKRTNATGYVTYEPINDETQDLDEFVTDMWFYVAPQGVDYDWFSSDDVYVNFSKSVTPADLNFEVVDRGDGIDFTPKSGLHIDTLGADDRDVVNAEFRVTNSDNVPLWGVPVTISASAGGYVAQGNDLDFGYDVTDMTAGSLTFNSGDNAWDLEDGCVETWTCSQDISFAGTKVGTATFSISSGSLNDGTTQEYFNLSTDGRYLAAVDTEADTVIGGNVVTASAKVTDRFGNAVANVWIEWSEDGVAEFTSNDDWAWPSQTDVNGLVSVNLLTPANATGSQVVKAWADDWTNEDADILWDNELDYDWQFNDPAGQTGGYTYRGEAVNAIYEITGLAAGNESVEVLVNWMDQTPSAVIKGVKGGVRVFVYDADSYVVKVFVDGKAKLITTADTDSLFKTVKVKAGKHTVKVVIWTPAGKVTKIAKVKVKALS